MKPHPYLRAFMAGIVVPTIFLLIPMTAYACLRLYLATPGQLVLGTPAWPFARAVIFPMAVVPNVWGLWNMVYLAMRSRTKLSLGLHGAILPLVLFPGGIFVAHLLDTFGIQLWYALPVIPVGMGIYYLAWKFIVGFLNQEMGIA